jgi:hypothetical protein
MHLIDFRVKLFMYYWAERIALPHPLSGAKWVRINRTTTDILYIFRDLPFYYLVAGPLPFSSLIYASQSHTLAAKTLTRTN